MSDLPKFLQIALQVLAIIMLFNLIIFVHELGHFLAAKWRGLQVDRFQIWFGRPIWKKTVGGVQYGLGWIPAGGFVALPQMAPMESIEGTNKDGKILPPIKPLDKIIVAFAGPLFSLLLALAAAGIVSQIGKPTDLIPSTKVGSVEPGSPAAKVDIRPGDIILEVNGDPVNAFAGQLDGIFERIILSKGNEIVFKIRREGEAQPIYRTSQFEITPKTNWLQRRALRRVGIGPEIDGVFIGAVTKGSPAERAGLLAGDKLLQVDGKPVLSEEAFLEQIKATKAQPFEIAYERTPKGQREKVAGKATLQAEVPVAPPGSPAMVGIVPAEMPIQVSGLTHPGAWQQVGDSLNMMWVTLNRVFSPDSSIGVDHLSGPVGIAKVQYAMLQMEHPFHRILAFFVLFNVNLAVLNMLPFPVLDGGHIVLATMEAVSRRPVKARILEWVQTAFALMLMGLMLYVASKDIFGEIGRGGNPKEVIFEKK